ncbi:EAL and HDOD domain-containing protein [Herminiimonas fonticola]|uniref:EAL and modified HD-GYP domain-containing signal transduction protein n=1 Tax=Herminiimonas fonticola TaxID=303380 RepID=A0A4R6GKA4_9BURK|nr:EAL domain-containing protein [Herminiimonas fonticola]RBA25643.1 putative signal transduction protein containing EAL and modified HD-GYP domain [Herminiimonas fonticola]TDN94754.1 EAL and modified HD-GYP domain-containing signal transduction protein [Herminiimonas fonticola]
MIPDLKQQLPDELPRVKEFFLARQPILNSDQTLVAYELLFRRASTGPANVIDDLAATASVIAHASELGIANVIGASLGFFNVDAAVLMCDFVNFLPCDKVVLEILETVDVTPELVARVAELAGQGFTFALDDVISHSESLQKLLPLVKIIKIDITGMSKDDMAKLVGHFNKAGKLLLAEKVETIEQFTDCMDLGFHYFQGYYFARPVILSGKKLAPSQLAIMQLLSLIVADADTAEIETAIKKDASLVLTLLRLTNTPAMGITQRIDSLGQALTVLGRRQLQRWLQIILYAEHHKGSHFSSPLLQLATTRGKLLELIAETLKPGDRAMADTAFTVGIMSLMDTLFGLSMNDILAQVAVVDDVSDALLYRRGFYGDLLKLAEYIERIEKTGPLLMPTLKKLGLSIEDLYALQITAFEWSNNVSRI